MSPVEAVGAYEAGEMTRGELFAELLASLTPSTAGDVQSALATQPDQVVSEFESWLDDAARGADVYLGRRAVGRATATFQGIQRWRDLHRQPVCEIVFQGDGRPPALEVMGRFVTFVEAPIAFLEHLAESWPFLRLEEVWPLDRPLLHPGRAVDLADSGGLSDRERADVRSWVARHNLTEGLADAQDVVVVREGRESVLWDGRVHRTRLDHLIEDLERVGDTICRETADLPLEVRSRWHERDALIPNDFRSLEVGSEEELSLPQSGQLRAVARMIRRHVLQPDERQRLLDTVHRAVRGPIEPDLRHLAAEATALIATEPWKSRPAYEQGVQLASWLRERLGQTGRVEPRRVLERWGVLVHEEELRGRFDAIALWDDDTAAIIVNLSGRHARTQSGRRATLAHEIGHLLVDRDGALPVAEVLGGGAPRYAEARANAFAAQYLVPRAEIERWCRKAPHSEAERTVMAIAGRYRASRQLVAHQLRNSEATADWSAKELQRLEQIARPESRLDW